MTNEQVMTLDNPTGLQLLEILQKIGFHPRAGDQIEISVNESTLTVRSLKETEEARLDAMMESIMDRHDNLFRRLAEGAK